MTGWFYVAAGLAVGFGVGLVWGFYLGHSYWREVYLDRIRSFYE